VQEFLEGEIIPPDDHLQVKMLNDFGDALNELEIHRFDLLILDVRLGPHSSTPDEEAGITTLQAIGKEGLSLLCSIQDCPIWYVTW